MCTEHQRTLSLLWLARHGGRRCQWALVAIAAAIGAHQAAASAHLLPEPLPLSETVYSAVAVVLVAVLAERFDAFAVWALRQAHAATATCRRCQHARAARARVH